MAPRQLWDPAGTLGKPSSPSKGTISERYRWLGQLGGYLTSSSRLIFPLSPGLPALTPPKKHSTTSPGPLMIALEETCGQVYLGMYVCSSV